MLGVGARPEIRATALLELASSLTLNRTVLNQPQRDGQDRNRTEQQPEPQYQAQCHDGHQQSSDDQPDVARVPSPPARAVARTVVDGSAGHITHGTGAHRRAPPDLGIGYRASNSSDRSHSRRASSMSVTVFHIDRSAGGPPTTRVGP